MIFKTVDGRIYDSTRRIHILGIETWMTLRQVCTWFAGTLKIRHASWPKGQYVYMGGVNTLLTEEHKESVIANVHTDPGWEVYKKDRAHLVINGKSIELSEETVERLKKELL